MSLRQKLETLEELRPKAYVEKISSRIESWSLEAADLVAFRPYTLNFVDGKVATVIGRQLSLQGTLKLTAFCDREKLLQVLPTAEEITATTFRIWSQEFGLDIFISPSGNSFGLSDFRLLEIWTDELCRVEETCVLKTAKNATGELPGSMPGLCIGPYQVGMRVEPREEADDSWSALWDDAAFGLPQDCDLTVLLQGNSYATILDSNGRISAVSGGPLIIAGAVLACGESIKNCIQVLGEPHLQANGFLTWRIEDKFVSAQVSNERACTYLLYSSENEFEEIKALNSLMHEKHVP